MNVDDIGVMSGAILDIEASFGLTLVQKQLVCAMLCSWFVLRIILRCHTQVVGSLNFISAFGALGAGSVSEGLGRRPCIALSLLLYSTGTAVMTAARSYATLLAGRVIVGLGVGVGMATVPVLVAELSPAALRGQLTSTFEVSICTGLLLGLV